MDKNGKIFLVILFIFSLLLKLFYGYLYENKFHPDKYDFSPHEEMAINFMQGNGLVYEYKINDNLSIKRYYEDELLYPLICGIVYFITKHNVLIMLLTQMFYVSFIPIFIYFISRQILGIKTARLAAILASLAPGIIVYSAGKIHSMTFYSLVFCVLLWAALRFIKSQNTANVLLLGGMLGIGILGRNTIIYFVPALFLYLFIRKKINIAGMTKVTLVIIAVLLPLIIRNYRFYNKVVILRDGGWTPVLEGTLDDYNGKPLLDGVHKEIFASYKQLTNAEYIKILESKVREIIRENKAKFIISVCKRFYYFWWFSPHTGMEYPSLYLRLYKPYYLLFLLFAIAGISVLFLKNFRRDSSGQRDWLLLFIFIILITIPHYLLYAEGRHRFAIEPILAIFTSYGILYIYNNLTKKR